MFKFDEVYNLIIKCREHRVVIYPYGDNGKLVKYILDCINKSEYILVDNKLNSENVINWVEYQTIKSPEDIIILTSENKNVHDELKDLYVHDENNVVDLYEKLSYDSAYNIRKREKYDHYDVTTTMLVDYIRKKNMFGANLLSVGAKVSSLISCLNLFDSVIHNTMIPINNDGKSLSIISSNVKFKELVKDFFSLQEDDDLISVDVVFSTACVHCMNDNRYGNSKGEEFKSYKWGKRLLELCPNVQVVVVSVPIKKNDQLEVDSVFLNDKKFIDSFTKYGYDLYRVVYICSDVLYEDCPIQILDNGEYVIASYIFER